MWKFTEQFKRTERWHKRLKVICKTIPKDWGPLEEEDDVLAFFQNCYHLKDWVINDPSCEILDKKKEVEKLINNSEFLKVCADLCNGSKHLELMNPRLDKETKITRVITVARHVSDPVIARHFMIKSGSKNYEALDLANRCIEEWKIFFKTKGMDWS